MTKGVEIFPIPGITEIFYHLDLQYFAVDFDDLETYR
jgi:hypothetical protein